MSALRIGWSTRELSLDQPMLLPGQIYTRISKKVQDPQYVTALCIDGGTPDATVLFLSCDTILLRDGVIEETKARVAALRPKLPISAIVMNATHTHTGGAVFETPEHSPDGSPIFSGVAYREFFVQQCAEAACEAWDRRKAGAFSYGYSYTVVGHSRRVVYRDDTSLRTSNALYYDVASLKQEAALVAPNGHGVMYGNTNDPMFSHYESGADPIMNLLFTFDEEQKLTGIVINVPCPSQLSEHFSELTADYWNEVRLLAKEAFGTDVYVLPQCAAAGDVSPRALHYKQAQERKMRLKYGLGYDLEKIDLHDADDRNKVMAERREIAERIVLGAQEVFRWACKDICHDAPVCHLSRKLQLPRRLVTQKERDWCLENIKALDAMLQSASGTDADSLRISFLTSVRNRNLRTVQRFEDQANNPTLTTTCHVIRLGDIAFATNQFELYTDYMHRIQAQSPFVQTFVVQLAGSEWGSYLATERAIQNKGYSASVFCNFASPEGGQLLVDETLDMLRLTAQPQDPERSH